MAKSRKNFSGAADAALEEKGNAGDTGIFKGIEFGQGSGSDPMSDLLAQTSDYTIPEMPSVEPPTPPTPPADTFGDNMGEEVQVSAESIIQENRRLAGEKVQVKAAPVLQAPLDDYTAEDDMPGYAGSDESYVDPDRANRRRRVVSKFSAKFINDIVGTVSVVAHDAFVAPKEELAEHTDLMSRIADLSPDERLRLQSLDSRIKEYTEMKSSYAETAKMDSEELSELQECLNDVMETEEMNIHPGWLIVIIVGFQIVSNIAGIFFNRLSFRRK